MKPETRELIRSIRKAVAANMVEFELPANNPYPGPHRSKRRGPGGLERVSLALYEPGDDAKTINWQASAATGLQQIFKDETYAPRSAIVYGIACIDESLDFSSTGVTMREVAATALASVLMSSTAQFDFSLLCYGSGALDKCLEATACENAVEPVLATLLERRFSGTACGGGLARALALLPPEPSLVLVLSDFVELLADNESCEQDRKALERAGRLHTLRLVQLKDPAVDNLAELGGVLTLEDMTSGAVIEPLLSGANKETLRETGLSSQEDLAEIFRASRARSRIFSTGADMQRWREQLRQLLSN